MGVLNASARFEPANPVQFWANWNLVGDVSKPAAMTTGLKLGPGTHTLVTTCASADYRHTVWALRPVDPGPPEMVTVLTIAAYPEERIPGTIDLLARSARAQGIELKVCFAGEKYVSHSEMKIRRLREVIRTLDTPRVLFVDARDCLFLEGLDC